MYKLGSTTVATLVAFGAIGCSGDGNNASFGSGGLSQVGGNTAAATGGAALGVGGTQATGGATSNTGQPSNGGSLSAGSGSATGGNTAQGGVATGGTATGGSTATGGTTARAGASTGGTAIGGTTATGGSTARGGASAGGTMAAGGTATGGTIATGGNAARGGTATGGTLATGGAMATGGAATSGAAGCGVEPVTPNATANTRKVLCYLYSQYGNHILSGQEENNDDNGMTYIFQNAGKYPAIRAFDVNNGKAPTQCVDHWKKGGLCMFGYHMGITPSDGYTGSQTKTDINTLLTEGSAFNTTFKARLDKVAAMVQTVQDADGVAIMRLFHEAGKNCAWFWWAMEGGAQYVKVYRYAFNYLTVTKGLKNMIWMVPLCGSPDATYNPGKAIYDLGGSDAYAGNGNYGPLTSQFNQTVATFPGVPVALHENGPIPDPDQLKSTNTKWLLFNTWTSPYYQSPSNSVAQIQKVYAHDYVVTLDEMPGW